MDILSEFNNNQVNIPNYKAILELDYAFNKIKSNIEIHEIKKQPEIENKVTEEIELVQNKIDINKHWQVYYDNTYQMNFYYNPFTNESVWELPEGAEIATVQVPTLQNQQEDHEKSVGEESYYDEEAWEEDDLIEKLVYDKMKNQQLAEWMKRPARQQVLDTRRDTAYIEGNYDYNIWFDKYLTDRKEEREKIPALHRCNPALDIGYTKADLQEKEGGAYFCLFFTKGCCSEGVNCKYYHRVPTLEDANKIENLRDVFGRSRFATPRNDMGGIGTELLNHVLFHF